MPLCCKTNIIWEPKASPLSTGRFRPISPRHCSLPALPPSLLRRVSPFLGGCNKRKNGLKYICKQFIRYGQVHIVLLPSDYTMPCTSHLMADEYDNISIGCAVHVASCSFIEMPQRKTCPVAWRTTLGSLKRHNLWPLVRLIFAAKPAFCRHCTRYHSPPPRPP